MLETSERRVLTAVSIGLAVLVLAPIALSTQDLYSWARSSTGLGMPVGFAVLVPVTLDVAAAACIGMTIVCTLREERPGVFGVLVWAFAAASAWAQYRHGAQVRAAGGAKDLVWAGPMFALIGPVLLEVTLNRLRRWFRQESGRRLSGAAGFGVRWLPGIAFRETLDAWLTSRRVGIDTADAALAFVADAKALTRLGDAAALRYALAELQNGELHDARKWLQRRGRCVTDAAVQEVDAQLTARMTQAVTRVRTVRQPRQAEPVTRVEVPPVRRVTGIVATPLTRLADPNDVAAEAFLAGVYPSMRKAADAVPGASAASVRRRVNAAGGRTETEQTTNGHPVLEDVTA